MNTFNIFNERKALSGIPVNQLRVWLDLLLQEGRFPSGEGTVIVSQGFGTLSWTTLCLRFFLSRLGYSTIPTPLFLDTGNFKKAFRAYEGQLIKVTDEICEPVSIIAWSHGGLVEREVTRKHPGRVDLIITLGSPFNNAEKGIHKLVRFLYLFKNIFSLDSLNAELYERIKQPLPTKSASIFSWEDGVVSPESCCQEGPRDAVNHNFPIKGASHLGLCYNYYTYLIISHLLAGMNPFFQNETGLENVKIATALPN